MYIRILIYYYNPVLSDVIATIATYFMLIYIQITWSADENVMKCVLHTKLVYVFHYLSFLWLLFSFKRICHRRKWSHCVHLAVTD